MKRLAPGRLPVGQRTDEIVASPLPLATILALMALQFAACAQPAPGPKTVLKNFYQSARASVDDRSSNYMEHIYEMLSPADQKALREQAEQLNKSLPATAHFGPAELLLIRTAPLGALHGRIEMLEEEESRVKLRAPLSRGTLTAELRRHDGTWRIQLDSLRGAPLTALDNTSSSSDGG